MAINFPDTPTLSQTYQAAGITWQWDGTTWISLGGTFVTPSASESDMWWLEVPPDVALGSQNLENHTIGDGSQWMGDFGRVNSAGFTLAGNGMTEADGVFSFPSIGRWSVSFETYGYGRASGSQSGKYNPTIEYSSDSGGAWDKVAEGWGMFNNTTYPHMTTVTQTYVFDITDLSQQRVRFRVLSSTSAMQLDHGNNKQSRFIFKKLEGVQGVKGDKGDQGDPGTPGASGTTNFVGLTDTPSSLTPDKWLKVNAGGTALEETEPPEGGSQTLYQGSISKGMDENVPEGYGYGSPLGLTGFTDPTTYPQEFPTYSDSGGGNGTGILNAFDGDEHTYSVLTPPTAGGWSKITFTNPLGLRTDGTKEITEITIGFDGQGKFGYNGGNTTTISTGSLGSVQEISLYSSAPIQLDDLYFESVTGTDELKLYYVILDTNDGGIYGGTKLTIEKHEVGWLKLPTTGKNLGFYVHDGGDLYQNPSGLGLMIPPSLANATIGVKTDQPRYLVLPLGSKCTPGDTITILDLGMGRERRDSVTSYGNSARTSGNAGSIPILIYPASEDGIQGTHRENLSDIQTFSYSGPLKSTGILTPEPFHGTPVALTENGESIKLMWCGFEYGWRYLP